MNVKSHHYAQESAITDSHDVVKNGSYALINFISGFGQVSTNLLYQASQFNKTLIIIT